MAIQSVSLVDAMSACSLIAVGERKCAAAIAWLAGRKLGLGLGWHGKMSLVRAFEIIKGVRSLSLHTEMMHINSYAD